MKDRIIILHPRDWAHSEYGRNSKYEYIHISIGGKIPRKVSGLPTFDGYAELITQEGVRNLIDAFKKYQPKVFLFWIHKGFSQVLIGKLKKISPKTKFIMWYGNHRFTFPKGVKIYKSYLDMVVINSKDVEQYTMYKKNGIKYVGTLYDGFNPGDVVLKEKEPMFDCFFGGNSYLKITNIIRQHTFPGALIRYNFINAVNKNFNIKVQSDIQNCWNFKYYTATYHPLYTHSLRDANITLNINHFPSLYKAYTRRTIRSIFARRCHVTLYIPGMEEDFINHKHLVWFKTIDEGLDLIRYYLDHEQEREDIAWDGWKHAKKNFTFKNRLHDFEKMIEGL